jgi:ArsR family transcriptional regulator
MTRSTKHRYLLNINAIADFANALSHPLRVQILQMIAEREQCVCGELVQALPFAQSTISQHLKVLRNAGLISGEVQPPRICYCLEREALENARSGLNELFEELLM